MTPVSRTAPARAADPVGAAADAFFDALHRADEAGAVALATGLLDAGVPAQDVLLRLVGPAQEKVGALWETGAWSVADEHAATCINDRVVAAVALRTDPPGRRGHVVLGCLDGEWHALAPRLVGEVLRLHGWAVTFLGASVPPTHLVSFLHQHGPDVVALSAVLPIHLPAAHRTIMAVQATGTPVLAGGPGFGRDGRWARRLGVDAWAASAAEAVELLDARPWPEPTVSRDSRPTTVSGAEYTGLRERRGRLVAAGAERLRSADPDGAAAPPHHAAVDDDLTLMAEFLAAAAYLEDPQPFTDHLRWLAGLAAHRDDSGAALHGVLDAFAGELYDFPFALECLERGHHLLDGAAAPPAAAAVSPPRRP